MSDTKVLITEAHLYAIGDAIREKRQSVVTYLPEEMASAILGIAGGDAVLEPLVIAANGTYTPGAGVDGFNSVTAQVPTLTASVTNDAIVLTGAQAAVTQDAIDIDTRQGG